MNKVYVLPPNEGWIIDRFVKEWNDDNPDISVNHPSRADVIWLLADFCWRQVKPFLRGKKVLTSVHHIVPEKFDYHARHDFIARDELTTAYHVYNQRTLDFIKPLTDRPIHLINYWANGRIWQPTATKTEARAQLGLPVDSYIVGSFQRDTEGHDLTSPKLEKGPDKFADACIKLRDTDHPNLHVLLAGWRRQYVIKRLEAAGIPYTYFERPIHEKVNLCYQALDLYMVTARTEGGPQALIEAGLLNVPVVSTPVGIAEQVLPSTAIDDDVTLAAPAIPNVNGWLIPVGYEPYRQLIGSL